jgi:hypothetical protein
VIKSKVGKDRRRKGILCQQQRPSVPDFWS